MNRNAIIIKVRYLFCSTSTSTVFQNISDFDHCLNILKHISTKNHYADMTIHTELILTMEISCDFQNMNIELCFFMLYQLIITKQNIRITKCFIYRYDTITK